MSPAPRESSAELGTAAAVGIALTGVATAVVITAVSFGRRHLRGAQEDNVAQKLKEPLWPIPIDRVQEIGQSVSTQRPGTGEPHKGLDIFAAAGTEVRAAASGTVVRVVEGSQGTTQKQRRAGLFVDIEDAGKRIYRYLHLGGVAQKGGRRLQAGDKVLAGEPVGTVAPTGQSGVLHSRPHLHFEVRASDYSRAEQDYGAPLDPLGVLPLRLQGRSTT
jgi:murein DD-endopeptidase MepM/ murein hydrolase activator NlpD